MHSLYIARKLGVYRALYRINQSFANILTQCNELQELRILKSETTRRYRSLTQELQAELNRGLADLIEIVESRVHFRLVRARKAWEEEVHGPDRVLNPANARRRELAKRPKRSGSTRKKAAR